MAIWAAIVSPELLDEACVSCFQAEQLGLANATLHGERRKE